MDGFCVIGIKLNMNGVVGKVISSGNVYFGQVDIFGNLYLIVYSLICNLLGQVMGIWYVGYFVDLIELVDVIIGS